MNKLPLASLYDLALVFLTERHKYVCEGSSMEPTLRHGDVVLVDHGVNVGVGDIVVAKHPVERDSEVLKRIQYVDRSGQYFLIGDNLEDSNDSRHFGPVPSEYIKGKVVARVS